MTLLNPFRNCRIGAFSLALSLVAASLGCSGIPADPAEPKARLVELHEESLDGTSTLPAFRLSGVGELSLESLWLVRGEISKASLLKVGDGEVPSSVEKERVELRVERIDDDFLLVPLVSLEVETTYTVLALGGGKIGEFRVSGVPIRILRRAGTGAVRVGETIRFCGTEGSADREARVLGTKRTEVGASEGVLGAYCLEFTIPKNATEGFFSPPLLAGDVRFEPSPLSIANGAPRKCGDPKASPPSERGGVIEVETSPGFAVHRVKNSVSGEVVAEIASLAEAPGVTRLGPFPPATGFVLESNFVDGACEHRTSFAFETGKAAPYFVLSEVLADPIGPEPSSEWIEIENIGNGSGSTFGFSVVDSGGVTFLPDVTLPSGSFGLLVGGGFVVNPETDVIPDAKAVRMDVDSVGVRGLSNSGESLALEDSKGVVFSSIPALAAESGKSWTRIGATDDRTSFALREPTPGFR